MTIAEFKAWLEGFEHSFVGDPTSAYINAVDPGPSAEQYRVIIEKLEMVEEAAYDPTYGGYRHVLQKSYGNRTYQDAFMEDTAAIRKDASNRRPKAEAAA